MSRFDNIQYIHIGVEDLPNVPWDVVIQNQPYTDEVTGEVVDNLRYSLDGTRVVLKYYAPFGPQIAQLTTRSQVYNRITFSDLLRQPEWTDPNDLI